MPTLNPGSTLFAGNAMFVSDYFSASGYNFVIPEYQREFAWKEENVRQLFNDIDAGIRKLNSSEEPSIQKENGSKFLGCIIQWDREAQASQDFVVVNGVNYLSRVVEVIDGQQRICTISILLSELYNQFEVIRRMLDSSIEQEQKFSHFIENEVQEKWLYPAFCRQGLETANPQYRPIIIRQGEEQWSYNTPVNYKSPVARYLSDAINAIERLKDVGELDWYINLGISIKEVVECIRNIFNERNENPIDVFQHYQQRELLKPLTTGRHGIDFHKYLVENPQREKIIKPILDLVGFTYFLLHYCAFTVITSPNQDAALDMFQSLNATGVQLTALQILKPRLSKKYRDLGGSFVGATKTYERFEEVNNWLNDINNKDIRTKQFFLKFGLIFDGKEWPNNLSGQRSYLITAYDNFINDSHGLEKTNCFIDLLYYFENYLKNFYFISRSELFKEVSETFPGLSIKHIESGSSYSLPDKAALSIMFLVDSKHDIAHTLLARYYIQFQLATDEQTRLNRFKEFSEICKACTAFFVLWRTSLGEKYPDGAYREFFRNYLNIIGNQNIAENTTKTILREKLLAEVRKKARAIRASNGLRWPTLVENNLKYKPGAQTIIRFVLLLCADKKVPLINEGEPRNYGLIQFSESGQAYLKPKNWICDTYKTIEHVAPQSLLNYGSSVDFWSTAFATASDSIHSIGNLTLLSQELNSAIPETTRDKYVVYLSLVNPDFPDAALSVSTAMLIQSAPFHAQLMPIVLRLNKWITDIDTSIPQSSYAWDVQFIKQRADNISIMTIRDLLIWLK